MARTAVPYTSLVTNTGKADVTGTTADATNGHSIAAAKPEQTLIRVKNTDTNPHNVTVKAGVGLTPAWYSGAGDLVVSVPASSTQWIGPFESARFIQPDGSLAIDLASGLAGTVTAFLVPRH